jgi:hypothetical protein
VTKTDKEAKHNPVKSVTSAFGAKNRERLINAYFQEVCNVTTIAPADAWVHVYRLLLWVDQTTGLGHCYESDKSQPGKGWYARSLSFHEWVSDALDTQPDELANRIDWLFLRAAEQLAADVVRRAARIASKAERQRRPYEGRGFPRPGMDPVLISIVQDVLGSHFITEPSPEVWAMLVRRVRQYLSLDNKRKNLVGEGFEDVLTQVIRRSCTRGQFEVHARRLLHELPGFNRSRAGDKPNKVDVAVIQPGMRTLVTVKWSVRADREKQFVTDFADYVSAESNRKPFKYVFVTNEFDPARLMRACEQLSANKPMFDHVVHICTDAVVATYGNVEAGRESVSMKRVLDHIASGRLKSLQCWLKEMNEGA